MIFNIVVIHYIMLNTKGSFLILTHPYEFLNHMIDIDVIAHSADKYVLHILVKFQLTVLFFRTHIHFKSSGGKHSIYMKILLQRYS